LSAAKQAVLARLLRAGVGTGAPGAGAIRPRDPGAPAPLSGAQQRLWFLHQMEPGSAAFNIPLLLRLHGPLDVPALERALAEIVRRHEALRTLFVLRGAAPVQQVLPPPGRVLSIHDLPSPAADEREAALRAWAEKEAGAPFDLAAHPGVRARLLRVAADDHLLAVTLHHIVSDGWSTGVLYRELAALYGAFTRGQPSPLPPLAIQYADYAAWQRARLAGEEHARQVEYWRARLAGAPVLLDLPTDRPRPALQGAGAASHRLRIPRPLHERLSALARAQGATPFMAVAAAWAALLHRWSGQDDLVVGTPVAGRTHPQTEPLIGFFVQTLALRMDLSGDPSFRALLGRVRQTTAEAYAHQEVPLDQLVDELKVERSLSHPPVFQAMITLQNASGAGPELPGLRAETMGVEVGAGEGYLALYMEEDERGLDAVLRYPTDLWDAATMERMAGHLLTLLDAAADPDTRLSRLPLLGGEERARLLAAAAGPAVDLPALPAHRMIAAQAARTPGAVAVEADDATLTYAELDRRANRLAHHLRARGVGPETLVALCLERGAAMLAALLAVHRAGGAYLPLDPAYPADRIAYMLRDSGARALVSTSALLEGLPLDGVDAVALDRDAAAVAARPETAPEAEVDAQALAYVIYTSGSTGRPKGVMVRHGGLSNFLAAMAKGPGMRADGVLLAVTTLSFDIAALELLLPLTAGARVRIASREAAADPARLRGLLEGATAMQATPATWRMLLDSGWAPPRALAVLCGGEPMPRELARRLAKEGARPWNLYGPTETTIWSAALEVADADGPVPVGGPIDNTRLHVLDAAMQPAPLGVFGELYIGGEGLARGYLRRPALTAERFVPDPFSRRPGARLYRTGDRVRPLADGALELSGRLDTQVKLRGFRVELGEVEAVLRSHPALREAAAAVRDDAPGGARLVAYVVPAGPGDPPSAAELRAHLGRSLPEYMLPSAFVAMDALPLTPAGKVDRRALPAPADAAAAERDHVPPATPAEKTIAGFWAEALGVERVGAHDNFFEIGGHSLLVPPLHARIRAAFDCDITLVDLFRHTTVAAQAAFVTTSAPPAGAPTVARQRAATRADLRRASTGTGRPARR
ncbi:MAG: amino acid adenylation domain-containing protein, partial [Gemmatimonadetes bacterium]|nr:amino acid adenylation domain-containing protein [Gemmatimonadota bacterium]